MRPNLLLLRKSGTVIAINTVSKVFGFIREVVISSVFGISRVTDSYFAIQQIPVMAQNYMSGAFTLAFVPHFAEEHQAGRSGGFVRRLIPPILLAAVLMTAIMAIGSSTIVPLITGIADYAGSTGIMMSIILSLSILPIALSGLAYGILHAERHHALGMLLQSSTPFLMLVSLLTFIVAFDDVTPYVLPVSFTAATIISAVWASRIVWSRAAKRSLVEKTAGLGGFPRHLAGSSLENVGFNLNQLANIFFAGTIGGGAVAVLAFSGRIAMLAMSGLVSPLNQVIQGALGATKREERARTFRRIAMMVLPIIVLVVVGLWWLRGPVVRLVYERGAFGADDTARVAGLLVPYAAYFGVMASNQVLSRYFFATFQGSVYSWTLIGGYVFGNVMKPFGAVAFGLPGVLWACVVGEGLALFMLGVRWSLDVRGERLSSMSP